MITTKSGLSEEIAATAKKFKGVVSSECVYGRFDVVVVVNSRETSTIDLAVHSIQKLPGVLHTETAISHYTEDYQSEKLKSQGIVE